MKLILLFKIIFLPLLGLIFLSIPILSLVQASSLVLNPPFGNVEEGKDLVVDVVLQANGEVVDGVDIVLTFETKTLKVKEVKKGTFFSNYPKEVVDGGQLKVSAISPAEGLLITNEVVVLTAIFEVINTGGTRVDLSFTSGSTTDSNVVLHTSSKDSLTEVKNGNYSVTASPEKIEAARKQAASKPINPLPIFLLIVIALALGAWYVLKNRKPKEDVFIPEPFPLDRPPKVQ